MGPRLGTVVNVKQSIVDDWLRVASMGPRLGTVVRIQNLLTVAFDLFGTAFGW